MAGVLIINLDSNGVPVGDLIGLSASISNYHMMSSIVSPILYNNLLINNSGTLDITSNSSLTVDFRLISPVKTSYISTDTNESFTGVLNVDKSGLLTASANSTLTII